MTEGIAAADVLAGKCTHAEIAEITFTSIAGNSRSILVKTDDNVYEAAYRAFDYEQLWHKVVVGDLIVEREATFQNHGIGDGATLTVAMALEDDVAEEKCVQCHGAGEVDGGCTAPCGCLLSCPCCRGSCDHHDMIRCDKCYGMGYRNVSKTRIMSGMKAILGDRRSSITTLLGLAAPSVLRDKTVLLDALQGWPQSARKIVEKFSLDLLYDKEVTDTVLKLDCNVLDLLPKDHVNAKVVEEACAKDGMALKDAPMSSRDDVAVVLAAVSNKGCALEFASERLRDNQGIVRAAVNNHCGALRFASESQRNDHTIMMSAISNMSPTAAVWADLVPAAFREDAEVRAAFEEKVLKKITSSPNNWEALGRAPEWVKESKEFLLKAVVNNGSAMEYASSKLRADRQAWKEIVQLAIKHKLSASYYA